MPKQPNPQTVEISKAQRRAHLWGYFKTYGSWFLGGAIALVLTNLLGLAIPAQIGDAVQTLKDAGTNGFDEATRSGLVLMGVTIIALAIGAGIARIASRIFIFNAGRYIEFDVRNDLYRKIASLDPTFQGDFPTGEITSRVTNDASYIRLLFAISFLHIINTTLAYGIALQKMLAIDVTLTLLCLAPYPPMVYLLLRIIRALFEQTKIVQGQLAGLSTKVQENLAGVAVIKTFNLQGREREQFDGMSEEYYEAGMRLALIRGALTALMVFLAGTGTLIMLYFGSQRVADGSLTLGEFVELNGYVVSLAFPTTAMGWVFSVWHRGQAAFDRLIDIFYRENNLKEPETPQTLPAIEDDTPRGAITFENVRFGYSEEEVVLRGIDLSIEAGSRVAIVGKTGSGKSTLIKLIARMYDPDEGSIRVDGVDVRDADLRKLRSELGVVPQDPFLFSMTIKQNIRFGMDALERDGELDRSPPTRALIPTEDVASDAEVTQEDRVMQSIEVAGLAQDLDAFPDGLDTLVGERGITLSGGQKQRVTIARALMTDPRILILDDALSSVDTQTESVILDHLDHMMEGRTSIIITHRFNALTRVDRIFVMDDGEIVERGTHDELIEAKGIYARMYEQQKLRESLD